MLFIYLFIYYSTLSIQLLFTDESLVRGLFLCLFVCFWRDSPPVGHDLLIHEVSRSHTTTHHSR